MKKITKVLLCLLIIVVVLVISAILMIKSYTHTLSNFVKDTESISVYIPDGWADDYINVYLTINEDHSIWEYKLNEKEAASINAELNNGIWKKLTEDDYKHIASAFFENKHLSLDMSESLYGCLFDCKRGEFVPFSEDDNRLLGLDKVLFIYDSNEEVYCCVHKAA